MGMLSSVRSMFQRPTALPYFVEYFGPSPAQVLGYSVEDLFRTQPHLRTLVTFIARNVSQLPLQTFQRVSDTDRKRSHDDPVARLFSRPNPTLTTTELIYRLVADLQLFDEAIWYLGNDSRGDWQIYPIPPMWIVGRTGTAWAAEKIIVQAPGNPNRSEIPIKDLLVFHGYHPSRLDTGVSPVEALKQTLAEQIQAWGYREQVWKRGGRVGAIITRPPGVAWSNEARTKFQRDWAAQYSENGPKAGGTPILEDGMTLATPTFNAKDSEWSKVAELSLATVASVYHTPPAMVGVMAGATFASVKELHKMLYSETLGPLLEMLEDRLNTFLVPRVAPESNLYVEFNIQAKLAGSFEEQAVVLSSSVGAPWMTVNEARARQNLPRLDGGDERVIPLNVLIGGQASPHDSGTQNLRAKSAEPLLIKGEAGEGDSDQVAETLAKYFRRQSKTVLAAIGASKSAEWWQEDRWDRELSEDLLPLSVQIATRAAKRTLVAIGDDADTYDEDRTTAYLRAVSLSRAKAINATTRKQIEAALDDEFDDDAERSTPAGVFDLAADSRSDEAGITIATSLAAFGAVEAARQQRPRATKTWVVNSGNPRSSHAMLAGETVPINSVFSNGMKFPGDPSGDVDEIAGCQCTVDIEIP